MWGWYMIAAAAVGLGVWATWLSGRDVGMRNAARMAEQEEEPTLLLKIERKGGEGDGVHPDEYPGTVCSADPVRAENAGDQKDCVKVQRSPCCSRSARGMPPRLPEPGRVDGIRRETPTEARGGKKYGCSRREDLRMERGGPRNL